MKISFLSFQFVDDEHGMYFSSGSDWPQASQMCCDTPPVFWKDIPRLNFLFDTRSGAVGKDLIVEYKFSWVDHRSRMYHRPLLCEASPIPQLC